MTSSTIPAPTSDPHAFKFPPEDGYLKMNKAVRTANTFPFGNSFNLFSTYTDFNIVTSTIREKLVLKANNILAKELTTAKIKCTADDDTNMEKIIDANDSFLDRINRNMDILSGVNDPSKEFLSSVRPAPWNREPVVRTATIKVNGVETTLYSSKNIQRPQLLFSVPVDNSEHTYFKPIITEKPNCIEPLDLKLLYAEDGTAYGYEHPYKPELEAFEPGAWAQPEIAAEALAPPPELSDTPLTMVETVAQLDALVAHLDQQPEIAVDLEHHSFRSYQGITCLMQISTDAGGDFLVDTLLLRDHLHKLNSSFTNPNKLKVFHGADNDIQWLQRDFGVYVVGLFDTHQAAKLLNLPGLSLKYLLEHYCNIYVNKARFHLADWRLRPLPGDMVEYARTDTHYLLYLWRTLRRALLAGDAAPPQLLRAAFDASRRVSEISYSKRVTDSESHRALYARSAKSFTEAQLETLRQLFLWRDAAAREEDESPAYILPSHMLLELAEQMPREVQGIGSVCQPMPPYVKRHLDVVHRIILACRESSRQQPRWRRALPAAVQPAAGPDRVVHDAAAPPPDRPVNLEQGWEVLEGTGARQMMRASVQAFDCAPPEPQSGPLPQRAAQQAPEHAPRRAALHKVFLMPYIRYDCYNSILKAEEQKMIKKEARTKTSDKGAVPADTPIIFCAPGPSRASSSTPDEPGASRASPSASAAPEPSRTSSSTDAPGALRASPSASAAPGPSRGSASNRVAPDTHGGRLKRKLKDEQEAEGVHHANTRFAKDKPADKIDYKQFRTDNTNGPKKSKKK